jgi:orotate phosphoribosyltransferase
LSDDLKQKFISLLAHSGALLTGDFELKSGRRSPYFVDFGKIAHGRDLEIMGACYADQIASLRLDSFDVIYGPAYKAIPIATATTIAIHRDYGFTKGYAFNRKVPKEYGEERQLLGAELTETDRVLIVDDVFTDGGAKLEALELLERNGSPLIAGIVVGVDRSEPGVRARFTRESEVAVTAICTIDEVQDAVGRSSALQASVARRQS